MGHISGFVRRRPVLVGTLAGLFVVAVAVVLVWFQPHKLFIDDRVDEAAPAAAVDSSPVAPDPEPAVVAMGDFRSLEHATAGRAAILDLPGGQRLLRLEDLDTSNGPDLRVYLSTADVGGPPSAFDDDALDLGTLKGNIGSQNYDVPSGTDLSKFKSAVIWCRRFRVAFGAAPLSA